MLTEANMRTETPRKADPGGTAKGNIFGKYEVILREITGWEFGTVGNLRHGSIEDSQPVILSYFSAPDDKNLES